VIGKLEEHFRNAKFRINCILDMLFKMPGPSYTAYIVLDMLNIKPFRVLKLFFKKHYLHRHRADLKINNTF
jgi:hypothetical protein